MLFYSLDYAFRTWDKAHSSQTMETAFGKKLSVALRFFVIPELEPELTLLKPKELNDYSQKFRIERLKNALDIFDRRSDEAMASQKLSPRTRANYRSALVQFMAWIEQQVWWGELFSELKADFIPSRVKAVKAKSQTRLSTYGLQRQDFSEELKEEIVHFREFRESGGKNLRRLRREQTRAEGGHRGTHPKVSSVKASSFKNDEDMICRFLGWYQQEYPENDLSIQLLTNIQLLDDFTYWLVAIRKTTYSAGEHATKTGIAIAKWLNYSVSKCRDWSDVPLILNLQNLQSEYAELYQQEKKIKEFQKWQTKELSHEDARRVVQYLQRLCAPYYGKSGSKMGEVRQGVSRSLSAIVGAWQTYITTKFFVYCPVRQEEFRHLKLGETLLRQLDKEGNPFYVVRLKEHKRSKSGIERRYRIPSVLTSDLEMWINHWRPLMVNSLQSVDEWMRFWGLSLESLERLKARLEAAKRGEIKRNIDRPVEDYIERLEMQLQGGLNRYDAWETAKENLSGHNYLFFMMAKSDAMSFGQPHTIISIWSMVRVAIALATTALFGETKWTNPHALRHIAEKHIRLLNKSDMLESFGTFIGHSKEMGDLYAAQIMTDYELAEKVVDDWWL